ncbi:MAG: hypothetical protein M1819_007414 [Sarea resinae]|nr:MAG: hypothetical protein M1819_007414 [Sarea resinae]
MLQTSTFIRWLQRKRYQYEVTYSLYMLTPTEKFIFNSFLFLFLSMVIIAISLYLPGHINTVANRAWFYYAGDDSSKPQMQAVDGLMTAVAANASLDVASLVGGAGAAAAQRS